MVFIFKNTVIWLVQFGIFFQQMLAQLGAENFSERGWTEWELVTLPLL